MTTPSEIFEGQITKTVAALENNEDVIYQFCIEGDGGCDYVVNRNDNSVTAGKTDAAGATISLAASDFTHMVQGKASGTTLFMMGKLRVEGDIALAMKLGQIF